MEQKVDLWVLIHDLKKEPAWIKAFWRNSFLEKQDCLIFSRLGYRFHVVVRTDRDSLDIPYVKQLLVKYMDLYLFTGVKQS